MTSAPDLCTIGIRTKSIPKWDIKRGLDKVIVWEVSKTVQVALGRIRAYLTFHRITQGKKVKGQNKEIKKAKDLCEELEWLWRSWQSGHFR